MTGKEELLKAFTDQSLVRPLADQENFVDLIQALAHLGLDRELPSGTGAESLSNEIGSAERYVFVLVDGLGLNQIEKLGTDSFLGTHLRKNLLATFLSTTASALTTLATGLWPAEHAMPGWYMYLPERDISTVTLPFVERATKKPLTEMGLKAENLFPVTSIWQDNANDFKALMPNELIGSVYTNYSFGPGSQLGYKKLADGITLARETALSQNGPRFTYLYLPHFDYISHLAGPDHKKSEKTLKLINSELNKLALSLKGQARLVISADHGLIHSPEDVTFALYEDDPLCAHLKCLPTGDGRTVLFHCRKGLKKVFAHEFRDRFGEHFILISVEEAEDLRLFGPMPLSPIMKTRLGDYIGLARSNGFILGRYKGQKPSKEKGHHGGLSSEEMNIPLILA